jgi:hypothetical protein
MLERLSRAALIVASSVAVIAAVGRQTDEAKRAGEDEREQALRRAQVWIAPEVPMARAELSRNDADTRSFDERAVVRCRFKPDAVSGSTPKFDCALDDGRVVKVKYGRENPEVYSEVIASRLLSALGFPTDRMFVVERVSCRGCPPDPFPGLQCLNDGGTEETCFPGRTDQQVEEFDHAVIELPLKGRRIETRKERGWRWDELSKIDPQAGGAPRAHVDALRLMAVFLSHWDNKSKNQRLLCRAEGGPDAREASLSCRQPVAMIQDLGGTFGPFKLDADGWSNAPVWTDVSSCRVSMRALPYGGSTFPDTVISEEGRAFLAERLGRLTDAQVRALFTDARVDRYPGPDGRRQTVDAWVQAFRNKVQAIVDHHPCPAVPAAETSVRRE